MLLELTRSGRARLAVPGVSSEPRPGRAPTPAEPARTAGWVDSVPGLDASWASTGSPHRSHVMTDAKSPKTRVVWVGAGHLVRTFLEARLWTYFHTQVGSVGSLLSIWCTPKG